MEVKEIWRQMVDNKASDKRLQTIMFSMMMIVMMAGNKGKIEHHLFNCYEDTMWR